jgi:hypothetical protein
MERKQELIDALAASDYHYIKSDNVGGMELLNSYLEFGFPGYANMTLSELEAEYAQRESINTL